MMENFQNAVNKALDLFGPDILENKQAFLNVIEDLVPFLEDDYRFLKKIYDNEIGAILKKIYLNPKQKVQNTEDIKLYLLDEVGLSEKKISQFLGYFVFASEDSVPIQDNDTNVQNFLAELYREFLRYKEHSMALEHMQAFEKKTDIDNLPNELKYVYLMVSSTVYSINNQSELASEKMNVAIELWLELRDALPNPCAILELLDATENLYDKDDQVEKNLTEDSIPINTYYEYGLNGLDAGIALDEQYAADIPDEENYKMDNAVNMYSI